MGQEPAQSPVMFAPKFKAMAPTGKGIWTPQTHTPSSSASHNNLHESAARTTPTPPPPPAQPIWTPQPSPVSGRKQFRPVRFESPTLPRRYTALQQQQQPNAAPIADSPPPWSYLTNNTHNQNCPLPPTPPPPRSATSCTNLSTPNTTVSSSTIYCDSHYDDPLSVSSIEYIANDASAAVAVAPTSGVSEKIKTFERSASTSALHYPSARRQLHTPPAHYRPHEVIYNVKHEYMSEPETENDRPRKMAQLRPRQYDGIGPVTNDGMPIILRSEVKEPHQHEWYKRLYQTIHKQKNGDDYVIRYKCPRGRYQHKANGYLSEPEPNYDSDYSTVKYRTLDRRRLQSTTTSHSASTTNVRSAGNYCQDDASSIYGTMPNPIKSGQNSYKNQPGRIEDYVTGRSSVSEKEKKEWWDEVMDIFNGWLDDHATTTPPRIFVEFAKEVDDFVHLEQTKLSPHYTEGNLSRALAKESGYASDSNLVFRKKEVPLRNPLSPVEQKQAYKSVQSGGEPPLFGFRKPAPEKPKEFVEEFEYFQITPTLTKIRVHSKEVITTKENTSPENDPIGEVLPELQNSPGEKMYNPFSKHMPSFIAMESKQPPCTAPPPPPPPNRKSSRTRTTVKVTSTKTEPMKRPTSASSSHRHDQCFQSPEPKIAAQSVVNKFGTFTVRKHGRREPLCRSKSAGAVNSTLLSVHSKEDKSCRDAVPKDTRISRIQQTIRLRSLSPTRQAQTRVAALRQSSRSPVAFGRSISKERTFAEEKKRLETTLPVGRTNFEASTNILRDPSLKSPAEVKQAIRSYATCPMYARSKSVPRVLSPTRYPNFSVSTTTRHSMCLPQTPKLKSVNIITKQEFNKPAIKPVAHRFPNGKVKTLEKSASAKTIPKHSSTTSLARTSSTFSVDSTPSKLQQKLSTTTKKLPTKSIGSTIKECTKHIRRSAAKPSAKANALTGSKSESNVLRRIKEIALVPKSRKETSAPPPKLRPQPSNNQIFYTSHYSRESSPVANVVNGDASMSSLVHEKTRFWNEYNNSDFQPTSLVDQKYLLVNQTHSLSPIYSPDYEYEAQEYERTKDTYEPCENNSEFGDGGGIEDLVWRIEQRSRSEPRSNVPIAVCDIARPVSPSPHMQHREFSPTREVRVPQTQREVRSPSRRRIEGLRPGSKVNALNVVRASSLSSADDRSKRGLYLCGELAHSATSVASTDRHSPTCRYRNNSDRFTDLNRFYSTLERVGQLERATSTGNLKPIRPEGEALDFEEWRKLRLHERAEKELSYLVDKLKQDQREKDFVFRPKDVEDVKWNEEKDFGLRAKNKSVEDLRDDFENKIHQEWCDEAKRQEVEAKKDIYKPYWRSNTVADLASSMEVKYNPESGSFAVQQKTKCDDATNEICLSNRLVSTLSKDQILKITHQLNEIYSPESKHPTTSNLNEEYVVTVNKDTKPGAEANNLKVRCNSSITKEDLMGPVMRRKQAANKASAKQYKATDVKDTNLECQARSTRSNSPVMLARETRGAIAAENAKFSLPRPVEIPPPPPLPSKSIYKQDAPIKSNKLNSLRERDAISEKIQYFEEKKYDEPPKTIYHAREDSSPDEDEVMRVVAENMHLRSHQPPGPNHKELSSSLTDLHDMFGEKHSARVNFPSRPPPPLPPDMPQEESHNIMNDTEEAQEHDFHDFHDMEPYYRSRSASPQSQMSTYLHRVRTGEVQKIKDKFESLGRPQKKQHHFFGLSPLRKVRSDPELNNINAGSKDAFKTIININETGDVSWITHKFELQNQCQSTHAARGRNRSRKVISPVPHKDRLMPHIDIISKTAALKQDVNKRYKSPSPIRSSGDGVQRTRCKFESSGQRVSPLGVQMSCSSPDISDMKDIAPHLTASWIAHKYPKPVDNALIGDTTTDGCNNLSCKTQQVKRCLRKLERRRANSTSPPRPPKSAKHQKCAKRNSILKPYYDIFANQNFDPKKHQPKARYVPDEAALDFWKKSSVHPACSGTCGSLKKSTAVKFQDLDVAPPVPPQPPRKGVPLESNGHTAESPNRYLESDVNIHYKTPIRYEYKDPVPEEELAIRQAEQMQKLYQEERRRKYLQELQDMNSRRHTDNFTPTQKSPIPLNRYDDFQSDLAPKSPSTPLYTRTVARALYNFQGQTARELSFKKGDMIYIRRQIDKNWFEGEHNAMIGLLPANYVEILSKDGVRQPARKPSEGHARAKYNFQAQSGVELSLNKGELVTLTRKVDDNWFEGKIANRKGIFPVSYVEVLSDIGSEDPMASKTVVSSNSHLNMRPTLEMLRTNVNNEFNTLTQNGHQPPNGILRETRQLKTDVLHVDTSTEPIAYRALYKYRPQNSDELELQEGDIVHVLEKCDDGWYVGTSQRTGCFGTFPGNYVERA